MKKFTNQKTHAIAALVAGIVILIQPAILAWVIAIYLIIIGIMGLM